MVDWRVHYLAAYVLVVIHWQTCGRMVDWRMVINLCVWYSDCWNVSRHGLSPLLFCQIVFRSTISQIEHHGNNLRKI
jgi:hypothetical protein